MSRTCSNVGNLLVLRNAARRRELTVRAALGAGRARLILQFLVESTLLAAAGCIAGLFLARWGVSIVLSMLPLPATPDGLVFHMDARILAFAAGLSMLSALLFGAAGHTITLSNPAVPGVTLHYTRLREITDDVSDARVYGGIHFRFDQEAGDKLGRQVGRYVVKHHLRPERSH